MNIEYKIYKFDDIREDLYTKTTLLTNFKIILINGKKNIIFNENFSFKEYHIKINILINETIEDLDCYKYLIKIVF